MQSDMHYYAIYALALLAGLSQKTAEVIATASQYVDDSIGNDTLDHESGAKLIPEATAHHTADVRNLDRDHQRYIWIPFHFLPGNQGQALTERLVCREDSPLAKEVVRHHLGLAQTPFAVELMGITAHVYADTFAHFGFSGVSSRRNKVDNEDLAILEASARTRRYWDEEIPKWFRKYGKSGGWWKNIKRSIFSAGAEALSGALGHGAVLTFPDQPYLHWRYTYEEEFPDRPRQVVERENRNHYLEACRKLHDMFARFAQKREDLRAGTHGGDFDQAEEKIKKILAIEDGKNARARAWRKLLREDPLFGQLSVATYDADQGWNRDRNDFPELEDVRAITEFSVFRFFQAASLHRHYVLRELLPENGIVVI